MYLDHWGMRESPFGRRAAGRNAFRTPAFDEALARLHYLVEAGRRMGLLLGGAGSGKTTLLKTFHEQLTRSPAHVAYVQLAGLGPREFLWSLAAELALAPGRHQDIFSLWRMVWDHLVEMRYQQTPVVLLLDDADCAGSSGQVNEAGREVLAQIAQLAEAATAAETPLTVALTATQQRMLRLGPRLLELVELRIDIDPWQEEETRRYLRDRLSAAGGPAALFSPEAAARLHELAHGIPRRVNQLADLALLAAAGEGRQEVLPATIEGVYHELGVMNAMAR